MNEDKLKSTHDETIEIEEIIRENVNDFVAKFISKRIEGLDGVEGAIARAATEALNKLLASKLLDPIADQLTESLLALDLPDGAYLTTLKAGIESIRKEYFQTFLPEIAKSFAKLGLAEILTIATADSSPAWATAIRSVGEGVLHPVINNIVTNYFAAAGTAQVDIFKDVVFTEVFGKAIAGLLIDFEEIDKELLDDLLGLDGDNKLEEWVRDLLSGKIKDFVEDQFVRAIEFLAGKFDAEDIAEFFKDFGQFNVEEILGNFFVNFAGRQLADLFVEIDSLPEALLSQLGATIGSGALGEAMGALAMEALTGLFGQATGSAIGGAIFDGLFSILGAGVGAVAGSVIFELLDELFDGAISDLFGRIVEWIRNDSPQAFYLTEFDSATNAFHGGYLYSKDSESDLRLAVQKTMEAFESKINAVIAFVDEPASFDPYFDSVTFVWGKKHFNESYASYIAGNESNKLSYNRSAEHVAKETVGAVLSHMNFHEGHPITALAYDMWKAGVAAAGGSSLSYFADDNLLVLQNLVGLAHFANDYRQDPTVYDLLMASDAPIAVTILHQYLEADDRGFNAPTVLEGRVLGFEIVGSASAGDTLILNGPAWQAIARGGDDVIVAGVAALQKVDGGTGADTLVLAKGREAYLGTVTEDSSRTVLLTDIATGARIIVTGVETFRFNGVALSFEQAFPNHSPVITSNGAADRAWVQGTNGSVVVTTVTSSDADGEPRTYAIAGGADASLFSIDPVTGFLRFISAPDIDAPQDGDHDNLYEVRVSASDGRARDEQTLSIEVTLPVSGNTVRGTPGSDIIEFGQRPTPAPQPTSRDDLIYGGGGGDRINAGPGDDRVYGGDGSDIVRGGDGADRLFGGRNSDQIDGEAGNDVIDGGGAADRLAGGPGDDSYMIDDPSDTVVEGASEGTADRIFTSVNYTLGAGVHVEILSTGDDASTLPLILAGNELDNRIIGNAGANLLFGRGGIDRLEGLTGDDVLTGGGGIDRTEGGPGNDMHVIDNAGDTVVELAGEGIDTVATAVSYALAANVENLQAANIAGSDPLWLTGNALGNSIWGNRGNNVIDGGGGVDRMFGYAGNDLYHVDNAADVAHEEANGGFDTVAASVDYRLGANIENLQALDIAGTAALALTGNGLANSIWGNQGNNFIDGAGGADFMAGYAGNDVYHVDHAGDYTYEEAGGGSDTVVASVSYKLGANVENLQALVTAGTAALALTGNGLANSIWGTHGNNVIDGAGGADFMVGYAGNDVYHVDNAGDYTYEEAGGGSDTVMASVSYKIGANIENLQALHIAGTAALALTGNELRNYIWGTQGNNVIDGGAGADVMIGYGGNDVYYVDNAGDVTIEEAGGGEDTVAALASYALGANIENLQAANIGGSANLALTGNEQSNFIWGTQGNNVIAGRGGNDRIYGYGGADQFLFNTAAGNANFDWLDDFQPGVDKIVLDNSVFTALTDGALPSSAFVTGTSAADANDRIIFDAATGRIFYDADGSGAGSALLIAVIPIIPVGQELSAADFLVI